ncbi:hypothetical protein [Absidia glauca]|uniref:Uncharacterized protein n=1 Tax=Absidia glauca TaxID=4829 RepID=A0A168S650_ABSGL|nr:hypothetical protein [Absidia glauca]
MEELPTYSSSTLSPPSYEASIYAAQQEQESIWPRNYGRETPRIDVVKFYHDLILTCPYQDYDQDKDTLPVEEEEEDDESVDDSRLSLLSPSSSLSSLFSVPELDDGTDDDRFVSELNELLQQTWLKYDDIPSYKAFKAKVNKNQSLRPISNTLFRSSP